MTIAVITAISQLSFSRLWAAFLFILIALHFLLVYLIKTKPAALTFSDLRQVRVIPTWRTQTYWLPSLLSFLGWIIMILALMGPRLGHEETKVTTKGIAIGMVMDVSGSMSNEDMPYEGSVISRYETVEKVFSDFIRGNEKKELQGRANDMVSLIMFGKYVDTLCPLTLDHEFVLDLMSNNIRSIKTDHEKSTKYHQKFGRNKYLDLIDRKNPIWNGTAIYDGVALGADVMYKSDDALKESQEKGTSNYKIKSKVLIVLTDGQDQGSSISVEEAAKVAKEFGIKVYTIAIHGQPAKQDAFGLFLVQNTRQYDDKPLKLLASETGGKFYSATDPESLFNIVKDIEQLEKSQIDKQMTMEYSPIHRRFIFAGLAFLGLSIFLRQIVYKEVP